MTREIRWTQAARTAIMNIAALDPEEIDQQEGVWEKGIPCCFGAHLAKEFDVLDLDSNFGYQAGWRALGAELDLRKEELNACLLLSGSGRMDAFREDEWENSHTSVLENFLKMTHVPKEIENEGN